MWNATQDACRTTTGLLGRDTGCGSPVGGAACGAAEQALRHGDELYSTDRGSRPSAVRDAGFTADARTTLHRKVTIQK
jgi:hypothetical protein